MLLFLASSRPSPVRHFTFSVVRELNCTAAAAPEALHGWRNRLSLVDDRQTGEPLFRTRGACREPMTLPQIYEDASAAEPNAILQRRFDRGQRGRSELAGSRQRLHRAIAPARRDEGADGGAVIEGELQRAAGPLQALGLVHERRTHED